MRPIQCMSQPWWATRCHHVPLTLLATWGALSVAHLVRALIASCNLAQLAGFNTHRLHSQHSQLQGHSRPGKCTKLLPEATAVPAGCKNVHSRRLGAYI